MKKQLKTDSDRRKCIECGNCTDHYNQSSTGQFIMGKCSVLNHSVLLSGLECREFKRK